MLRVFKFVSVICIVIILSACTLPTPTTLPPGPSSLTTLCGPGELNAPFLTSPTNWSIVDSLNPPLMWSTNDLTSPYPYPYDDCSPSGYQIRLKKGPFFTTDLGAESYGANIKTWTPSTALEPGSEYAWAVAAFVPGGTGPYGGNNYFFTGPVCATESLAAPDLLRPMNGNIVTTAQPTLIWKYPNPCVPEGYRIDLSVDPSFSDTSLSGGTGNPSTRWSPGTDLADCTWYYWRVAPINGTTLGPFSTVRNFLVDLTGSCTYPLPDLIAVIPSPIVEPLIPGLTLDKNANCRFGPDILFEIRRSYFAGDVLIVKGMNDAKTWAYIQMPNEGEKFCWVAVSTGKLNVDPSVIPVVDSPPPPNPPADNPGGDSSNPQPSCSDYTTPTQCREDQNKLGCYWSQNNVCVKK